MSSSFLPPVRSSPLLGGTGLSSFWAFDSEVNALKILLDRFEGNVHPILCNIGLHQQCPRKSDR
jgi:hypothetical protein